MGEELSRQKPMPSPPFFFFFSFTVPSYSSSLSRSHPVLIPVLFVLSLCLALSFFLPHCVQHMVTLFSLFQNVKKSIWVMCSQGLLSKTWNIFPPSREILIEDRGCGGTTNKQETCKLERKQMRSGIQPLLAQYEGTFFCSRIHFLD